MLCAVMYFKNQGKDHNLTIGRSLAANARLARRESGVEEQTKGRWLCEILAETCATEPAKQIKVAQAVVVTPTLVQPQRAEVSQRVEPSQRLELTQGIVQATRAEPSQEVGFTQETDPFEETEFVWGRERFYIYRDEGDSANNFFPSGHMGDIRALRLEQNNRNFVRSGRSSIKVAYNPTNDGVAWAGIYWQYPANNWGNRGSGYNLTGATSLTFWARGQYGGEVINNFKVGGISGGEVQDSDMRSIGPIELSRRWTQYTIDLTGADLSNIIGAFALTFTRAANPEGAVVYLDEIVFN